MIKMIWALIIFGISSVAAPDATTLDQAEVQDWLRIKRMQWKPALSEDEKVLVRKYISSDSEYLALASLTTAVIHKIEGLEGLLSSQLSDRTAQVLAKHIFEGWREGKEPLFTLIDSPAKDLEPSQDRRLIESVEEQVSHIVAVFRARRIRMGKEDVLTTVTLKPADQMLIEYSRMPPEEAVAKILDGLAKMPRAETSIHPFDKIEILSTFPNVGLEDVLARLKDDKTTTYGKRLFLRYLLTEFRFMSDIQRVEILDTLESLHSSDPLLKFLIDSLIDNIRDYSENDYDRHSE